MQWNSVNTRCKSCSAWWSSWAPLVVALICDLLKGNNEQLRELAIELKVRREEENKRFQMLAPRTLAAPAPDSTIERPARVRTAPARPSELSEIAEQTVSQEHSAQQVDESAAARPSAAPVTRRPDRREKRTIAPDVLAVIQRGEQLAASPRPRRLPDHVPTERPAAEQLSAAEPPSAQPHQPVVEVPVEVPAVEIMQADAPAPALVKKSTGASRDWGSLLDSRRYLSVAGRGGSKAAAPVASEPLRSEPALPAGFQDGFVLTRLVESRQPVSGLVVSIGASTSQCLESLAAGRCSYADPIPDRPQRFRGAVRHRRVPADLPRRARRLRSAPAQPDRRTTVGLPAPLHGLALDPVQLGRRGSAQRIHR